MVLSCGVHRSKIIDELLERYNGLGISEEQCFYDLVCIESCNPDMTLRMQRGFKAVEYEERRDMLGYPGKNRFGVFLKFASLEQIYRFAALYVQDSNFADDTVPGMKKRPLHECSREAQRDCFKCLVAVYRQYSLKGEILEGFLYGNFLALYLCISFLLEGDPEKCVAEREHLVKVWRFCAFYSESSGDDTVGSDEISRTDDALYHLVVKIVQVTLHHCCGFFLNNQMENKHIKHYVAALTKGGY